MPLQAVLAEKMLGPRHRRLHLALQLLVASALGVPQRRIRKPRWRHSALERLNPLQKLSAGFYAAVHHQRLVPAVANTILLQLQWLEAIQSARLIMKAT